MRHTIEAYLGVNDMDVPARVRVIILIALSSLVCVAVGLSPPTALSAALERVRLIVPIANSLVDVSVQVAEDNGHYARNGLAVELTAAAGGGPDIQALISGNVDFDMAAGQGVFFARAQGQSVISVMAVNTRPVGDIVMRKDVADRKGVSKFSPRAFRLSSLHGTKLGVSTAGGFFAHMARFYIKKYGLKDVQIVPVGGGQTALAALSRGTIDALIYSAPVTPTAVYDGTAIWLDRPTLGEEPALNGILMSSLIVRADFLAARPDTVRRMVKSLLEANQWIKAHSPEEIATLLKPRFSNLSPEVLLESIKLMRQVVSKDGCASERGVKIFEDFLVDAGVLNVRFPWRAIATNDYLPHQCP